MPQFANLSRIKNGYSVAQSILAQYICLVLLIIAFFVFGTINIENSNKVTDLQMNQTKMIDAFNKKFPNEINLKDK